MFIAIIKSLNKKDNWDQPDNFMAEVLQLFRSDSYTTGRRLSWEILQRLLHPAGNALFHHGIKAESAEVDWDGQKLWAHLSVD